MYCMACGQQLLEVDAFCSRCGAAVSRWGQAQPSVPAPLAPRHSSRVLFALGITAFAFGLVSLALTVLSVCEVDFINTTALSLLAAMIAFGLGIAGARVTGRTRLYASLGMYLAVLTLAIYAFVHFLWLALHADWTFPS
jgi:hypothetical protein